MTPMNGLYIWQVLVHRGDHDHRSKSRSQEEMVAKGVSVTSSEGLLVYSSLTSLFVSLCAIV